MNLVRLAKALPAASNVTNDTEPLSLTQSVPNILEASIPGYGLISSFIKTTLGFDISWIVTAVLIIFAASKVWEYIWNFLESWLRWLYMSSVFIDEDDDLFDMIMAWLAEYHTVSGQSNRSVRAKTQYRATADDALDVAPSDALDEHGMFDYNKWSSRTPPRYEPHYGRHWIEHKGKWFFLRRAQKPSNQRVQVNFGGGDDDDVIQIDCIGRSTYPTRRLLGEIKIWSLDKLRNTTTIRHPTPKDRGWRGGTWSKTSSRPSRPMDTVILDAEQKAMIIRDMNEYLHPSSPKWYATRGIPYRRGYLFHGPPGTGKTSLSFALAGIFGLEIYAISLQEPTLTEGDLMQLFNALPRRCIVLLEDVDAAGLLRDGKSGDGEDSKKKKDKKDAKEKKNKDGKDEKEGEKKEGETKEAPKKDEDYTLKDLARELKSISNPKGGRGSTNSNNTQNGGHPNRAPGTGISLSGLLNVIDGVATHEGRVLVMTTNHPEKLDAALTRPGRIDRKVEFGLAMKAQLSELFVRMYAASDQVPETSPNLDGRLGKNVQEESEKKPNGSAKHASNGHLNGKPKLNGYASLDENQLIGLSDADLELLATEFASYIPDDTFTPAEVMNHLMLYKKRPRTAVEKAEQWVQDTLKEKEQQAEEAKKAEEEEDDDQ